MRTSLILAALALAPACIVVDGTGPGPGPNEPLTITYADAGCFWDDYYRDDVVFFDIDAADGNAGLDVESVWADVYDDRSGGWVDGFELYPEQGITWYSAWIGSSTYVDCGYPYYSVDFTAQTWDGRVDVVTVPFLVY